MDLVLNLPDCVLLCFLEKNEFHKLYQIDHEELTSLVQSMLWYILGDVNIIVVDYTVKQSSHYWCIIQGMVMNISSSDLIFPIEFFYWVLDVI